MINDLGVRDACVILRLRMGFRLEGESSKLNDLGVRGAYDFGEL